MLEIKKVSIRNFLSYGDYITELSFAGLGTTLITGEVIGSEAIDQADFNNGAGKSNVVNAILWCLFGKTMHNHNPGDKVINYFTKKDCVVTIEFEGGDTLTRTRNVGGHNDLLLMKDGEDVSLGTTTMQQEVLNKELELDWDIFCGSTFFSQYGKSWMEMSDQKRRQALEREFHLDRVMLYSEVAKEKLTKIELEQGKLQDIINNKRMMVDNTTREIERLEKAAVTFENNKLERIENANETLKALKKSRDELELIDTEALKIKWNKIQQILIKIGNEQKKNEEYQQDSQLMRIDVNNLNAEMLQIQKTIERWESQKGQICGNCEQPVKDSHIAAKIEEPKAELTRKRDQIKDIVYELEGRQTIAVEQNKLLGRAIDTVDQKKPTLTIHQAEVNNREYHSRCRNIGRQVEQIEKIKNEVNHYNDSVEDLRKQIRTYEDEIGDTSKKIKTFDKLLKHINYVYRAYSDRRKIKSYILQEYIPYLNERIAYYLNRFGLDLKLEFTNALGIKSNMWGYDFCSGGERKRMDVSIMLALFDLHGVMYGQQCNIVVFDEAERSLDASGVNILIDIIKNDIANKVDAVLVISHRNNMQGVFQSEIKIIREDRFSKISEILD
jgi:DNA repair exonuclease SbcCD ATPase subunit